MPVALLAMRVREGKSEIDMQIDVCCGMSGSTCNAT